jgi:hypothetical protein
MNYVIDNKIPFIIILDETKENDIKIKVYVS